MKNKLTLIIFFLLTICTHSFGSTVFPENREYRRNLFASDEECQEWRRTYPWVNCYQYAELSNKGRAFILLTDTPNVGTYSINENVIHVTFNIISDSPKEMYFTLSEDQSFMINELDGSTWKLYIRPN